MKTKLLLALASIILMTVAALSFGATTPDIADIQATPSALMVNKSEVVLVTATINATSLIPGSVNLWQLDDNNKPVAKLSVLHDDGVNGDQVAGDHVYSGQITFSETKTGYIRMIVTAAFRGFLRRGQSNVLAIQVWNSLAVINADKDFYGQNEGKQGIVLCWGNPPYLNGPQGTKVRIFRSDTVGGPWALVHEFPSGESDPSCAYDNVDGTTQAFFYKSQLIDGSGNVVYSSRSLTVPMTVQ